jgi:hypothetical protein
MSVEESFATFTNYLAGMSIECTVTHKNHMRETMYVDLRDDRGDIGSFRLILADKPVHIRKSRMPTIYIFSDHEMLKTSLKLSNESSISLMQQDIALLHVSGMRASIHIECNMKCLTVDKGSDMHGLLKAENVEHVYYYECDELLVTIGVDYLRYIFLPFIRDRTVLDKVMYVFIAGDAANVVTLQVRRDRERESVKA